jgi:hypothetical protein
MEEALGEFYLNMDEVMALTENLADHLDVDLPEGGEAEEVAEGDEVEPEADEAKDEKEEEKFVDEEDEKKD